MFRTRVINLVKLHYPNFSIPAFTVTQCQQKRLKSDLYEPNYLISMEPDEPVYDCLNLQLKCYDFAVLEACQKQIHRYAEAMGIQVDDCTRDRKKAHRNKAHQNKRTGKKRTGKKRTGKKPTRKFAHTEINAHETMHI